MAEQHGATAVGGRESGGKKRKKKKKATQSINATQSLPQPQQPPMLPDIRAPLQALLKTISDLIHQVRDEEPKTMFEAATKAPTVPPVPAFQNAAKLVSSECTKLAALFSSPHTPPTLVDCTAMACLMEQTITYFVNIYHHISPIYGVALKSEVQRCALPMLRGVESLINDIITMGTVTVQHGLRNTGSVWEYTDRAAKLSRDNKAAVVKELLSQLHLIRDGYREAKEVMSVRGKGEGWGGEGGVSEDIVSGLSDGVKSVELEEGEGDEETCVDSGPREWNEREKKLAELCVDLIKMCSELTNDLCGVVVRSGRCSIENGETHELDQTLAIVLELSPLVDELVGELPAPLLWPDCKEAGERLALTISQLLHTIRPFHFCKFSDKWMEQHLTYSTILSSITTLITTF